MNSRERVLTAVSHQNTDRVPLDYWSRNDVTVRLMKYIGVKTEEELYQYFDIDIRYIQINETHLEFEKSAISLLAGNSESSGKKYRMHEDGCFENAWGIVMKQGSDGLYDEWVSGPFVKNTDLSSFKWPDTDIFDKVEDIKKRVDRYDNNYATIGRIDLPFKICWHMRGFENFLCDMLLEPDYATEFIKKIALYQKEKGLRLIRAGVDIIGIYGDIAMQDRMIIDPDIWRKIEKPVLAQLIKDFKAEKPGISIFFHSDGDITEVLDDLIEIGVSIVNPIQPECMDPNLVKKRYGDKITMHGTISIQRTLPRGSVMDVKREVKERIETCGRNGGLIICPSNLIQNDTPLDNIIAIYDI